MQIDHEVKAIVIDENLSAELEKLQAEGYAVMPGVPPVAIYHVIRLPKTAAMGGEANLGVDDSKIHIIRGGNVVG